MRSHPLRDLGLAISQLTAIPVRATWPENERPDVASYYVWAGFLVALTAYVPVKVLEITGDWWRGLAPVVAALVLVIWAIVTRMLHWDGLGDVADGWFGDGPDKRRAIASDSHVGAFGVVAIVLVALVEYAALARILSAHEYPVLVVPAFARLSATFAAWFGRPAKPDGLGAAVVRKPGVAGVVSTSLGIVLASAILINVHLWQLHGVVVVIVSLLIAAAVPHLVAKRFGGITGDVLGASILIVEAILLVISAINP